MLKQPDEHAKMLKRLRGEVLNDWERGFCESVTDALTRYGHLTPKQDETVQKIHEKYTDQEKNKRENWSRSFTPEMRDIMKVVARYYIDNPPYFNTTAQSVINNPEFLPSEKQYRAMCENKYAIRVITNWNAPDAFVPGQLVTARKNSAISRRLVGQPLLLVEYLPQVLDPVKGTRQIRVLPVGSANVQITQERYLKSYK